MFCACWAASVVKMLEPHDYLQLELAERLFGFDGGQNGGGAKCGGGGGEGVNENPEVQKSTDPIQRSRDQGSRFQRPNPEIQKSS